MDDGHVIPGLNEDWTFAGAKLMEWMAGVTAAFLCSMLFERPAHFMPYLILVAIGSALLLASLRKKFPDQERGVRNLLMTACGFSPPGIPTPAKLQPRWSGGRISSPTSSCMYMQLGLDVVVDKPRDERDRR
jgi:hypothetical protein